jgi:hypothetical protein
VFSVTPPTGISSRLTVGFLWLLASPPAVSLAAEGGPAQPGSVYSLSAIRAGIAASRARLRSQQAEYVCIGRDPKTGELDPESIHNFVAARGVKRFHESGHFTANIPWELDPVRHKVYFTGRTLDLFYPILGLYETSERNAGLQYSWKVQREFFWECQGWWPPDDDTKPFTGQPPFFLHEVLAQKDARVRPYQEQADGAWCHVVEVPGVDELWLDPAVGFALRRRNWSGGEPGALFARYELSDYREAAPKVWMPWKIHRIVYDTRSPASGRRPVLVDALATVLSVKVNDVPAEVFQFTPPPGTLVQDRDTGKMTQVPGGLSFLDEVIEYTRRIHALRPTAQTATPLSSESQSLHGYCLVGAILVLTALDLYLLRKAVLDLRKTRRADGGSEAAHLKNPAPSETQCHLGQG